MIIGMLMYWICPIEREAIYDVLIYLETEAWENFILNGLLHQVDFTRILP